MKNILAFCKNLGVSEKTRKEFELFCKVEQSQKFHVSKNGTTAKFMVSKMTQSELQSTWSAFVVETKRRLS